MCKIKKISEQEKFTAGGFKAKSYVMSCAKKVGAKDLEDLKNLVNKQISNEYKNSLSAIIIAIIKKMFGY